MNAPTTPQLSDADRLGATGPIEPAADLREGARHLRHLYVALRMEGFVEMQALNIIGMSISTAQAQRPDDEQ